MTEKTPLHFKIMTLFPDMFPGPLGQSISGRALKNDLWRLSLINIRDYATDKHKTVDDTPFGGGAGMVLKPDVLSNVAEAQKPLGRFIYMSPRGKTLTQDLAKELVQEENITILCGRYEGVDQRFLDAYDIEEVSVGDYVLSGGEMAALTLMDACIRLIPDVMGNQETTDEESFENGLLEYPLYTRPAEWEAPDGKTYTVPDPLKSGNHAYINEWRHEEAIKITQERRPDLWENYKKINPDTQK